MEPTHDQKTMAHKRDLVHALMAAELLENNKVSLESLVKQSTTGEDFVDKESRKLPAAGIEHRYLSAQLGTQKVTSNVIHGPGYGPGELPEKTMLAEKIRVQREINLFTRWMQSTGQLERLEDRAPGKEDLKNEIRKRLHAYLSKGKS